MGNEEYTKILNRYLYTDIILIAILLLVSFFVIVLILKFFSKRESNKNHNDWSNKTARRVLCVAISLGCILAVCITGKEVLDVISDLNEEDFVCCTCSYTASRNEIIVRTENGDIIRLKYLHRMLNDFESEYAEIVYSDSSRILLSCKVKYN